MRSDFGTVDLIGFGCEIVYGERSIHERSTLGLGLEDRNIFNISMTVRASVCWDWPFVVLVWSVDTSFGSLMLFWGYLLGGVPPPLLR